nr:DHH family phosphoesterase [Vibrio lentus]
LFYCDHHRTGEVPQADNFTALINLDANTCTSLLINQHLAGRYADWAIVGAYGDNMFANAEQLADSIGLSLEERAFLKELGTLVNYNGYGASIDDLHITPKELFQQLMHYVSPFD